MPDSIFYRPKKPNAAIQSKATSINNDAPSKVVSSADVPDYGSTGEHKRAEKQANEKPKANTADAEVVATIAILRK